MKRPDGNDVNIDREGFLLAETQMQFGLGVQLMQHEFHNLLYAINEGNKVMSMFTALEVSGSALGAERQTGRSGGRQHGERRNYKHARRRPL